MIWDYMNPEDVAEVMGGRQAPRCPACCILPSQLCRCIPWQGWGAGRSLRTVGYQVEPAGDEKWFLPSTTSFLLPQHGQARAQSNGKLPNVD